MRFVLLRDVGNAFMSDAVDPSAVLDTLGEVSAIVA